MCKKETDRSAAEVVSDDKLENSEAATAVDLDEIEAGERARDEEEETSKDRNVEQLVISFGRIGVTMKDLMMTTKYGKFNLA